MGKLREYYERNLPHYQPEDYVYFVTFRLYGTLPADVVEKFKAIKNKRMEIISGYTNTKIRSEKYEEFLWEYFELYDNYINKCNTGVQWLRRKDLADIVKEALHYRDRKEYDLIAYTIMPNHVHMVFIPVERPALPSGRFDKSLKCRSERNTVSLYRVTRILQHLKKNTAIKCNKALNRTGAFWQHESYDHVVRNADELKRIVDYALNNPVKARLADTPEEWEYNYVNYEFIPVL